MHDRLFIEAKLREKHAIWTLFDQTAILAKKENKVPVLAVKEKSRKGEIYCIHSDDLEYVLEALLIAKAKKAEEEANDIS